MKFIKSTLAIMIAGTFAFSSNVFANENNKTTNEANYQTVYLPSNSSLQKTSEKKPVKLTKEVKADYKLKKKAASEQAKLTFEKAKKARELAKQEAKANRKEAKQKWKELKKHWKNKAYKYKAFK